MELWAQDHNGRRNDVDGEPSYPAAKPNEIQTIFEEKMELFMGQAPVRRSELLNSFKIRLMRDVQRLGAERQTMRVDSIDNFKDSLAGLEVTEDEDEDEDEDDYLSSDGLVEGTNNQIGMVD